MALKKQWLIQCQQSGAVNTMANRSEADVVKSKSLKVLEAFKVALGDAMHKRMMMYLSEKVPENTDITTAFSCKWKWITEAFEEALGHDTKVKCLTTFFSDRKDTFGNLVVDQALHEAGAIIDNTFGALGDDFKDARDVTGTTRHILNHMKFRIAFKDIYMNLPVGCALIKNYLGTTLEKYMLKPTVDYSQFLRETAAHMATNNWMKEYQEIHLPANSNKMSVNNAGTKENKADPEAVSRLNKEFKDTMIELGYL